jgi:hypothetical protein
MAPLPEEEVRSSGPPPGWHASDGGWWGPDGLFYAGDAPWESGATGVSYATAVSVQAVERDPYATGGRAATAVSDPVLIPGGPDAGFIPQTRRTGMTLPEPEDGYFNEIGGGGGTQAPPAREGAGFLSTVSTPVKVVAAALAGWLLLRGMRRR